MGSLYLLHIQLLEISATLNIRFLHDQKGFGCCKSSLNHGWNLFCKSIAGVEELGRSE